ncbi:MAG: CYTH domain-containing protein [Oscillospiraceae bacterium]|nr:CYTH domain-containing protein [Oscillospiraceae bacterium]
MGREFELKYRADAAQIAAIAEKYRDFSTISMETTYYDTPDLKLAFHHWTLRRRLENGESVITFKRPLDDGSKAEWEVSCDSVMQGIMDLCRSGADWELMRITAGGLIPLCGAKFTRRALLLTLPGCTAELALDQGILTGAKGEAPISEVEVELKSGSDQAAAAFAQSLAAEFGLEPEPKSKFARAMLLAI